MFYLLAYLKAHNMPH